VETVLALRDVSGSACALFSDTCHTGTVVRPWQRRVLSERDARYATAFEEAIPPAQQSSV